MSFNLKYTSADRLNQLKNIILYTEEKEREALPLYVKTRPSYEVGQRITQGEIQHSAQCIGVTHCSWIP